METNSRVPDSRMPGSSLPPVDSEILLRLLNEAEQSIFVICTENFGILSANKAFLKAVHRHEDYEGLNLMHLINSGESLAGEIGEGREIFRKNIQLRPDNRLFRASFIKQGGFIFFAGELLGAAEGDILASMSRLSNETANIERELRRKNRDLENANRKIEELMRTDPLTGLYNRRYLIEFLSQSMNMALRHNLPLSIIMGDIDNFKQINDSLGHDAGDAVLQGFADIMKKLCRKEDIIVRFGGEEFIIALQKADSVQALAAAEKIRVALEESFILEGRAVTASFGISQFISDDSQNSLIKRADTGLYRSKNSGKNRCTVVNSEAG